MSPDEEKKLRQLLIQKRQLPEPNWNLIARATKRQSRTSELTPAKSYVQPDEASKRYQKR